MAGQNSLSLSSSMNVEHSSGQPVRIDQVPWHIGDVIVGVAVLMPLLYLSQFYSEWFHWLPDGVRFTLIATIPLAWMTLYPQWVARSRKFPIRGGLPPLRACLCEVAVALPIALFSIMALMGTSFFYQRFVGESLGSSSELARGVPPGELLSFLLISFTLIPIAEEVFFRGFVYNALRKQWGLLAIIIQALLFAVVHPYSLPQRLVIFATGIMLGMVYHWRRSLVAPIFVHATHNFIMSILIAALITANAKAPYMGVAGTVDKQGHVITQVTPDSPADEADLRPGDIIVRIDDSRVNDGNPLSRILRSKKAGQMLKVELLRQREPMVLLVKATQRPYATGLE